MLVAALASTMPLCHAQSTGTAKAEGMCIVANTGPNAKISQTCTVVDPKLFKQFEVIAKKTKNDQELLISIIARLQSLLDQFKVNVKASAQVRGLLYSPIPDDPRWGTQFWLTSTATVSPIRLVLKCSGPVRGGAATYPDAAMTAVNRSGPLQPGDPTTLLVEMGSPEAVFPNKPLHVYVYSDSPVAVISGTLGPAQEPYEIEFPK